MLLSVISVLIPPFAVFSSPSTADIYIPSFSLPRNTVYGNPNLSVVSGCDITATQKHIFVARFLITGFTSMQIKSIKIRERRKTFFLPLFFFFN